MPSGVQREAPPFSVPAGGRSWGGGASAPVPCPQSGHQPQGRSPEPLGPHHPPSRPRRPVGSPPDVHARLPLQMPRGGAPLLATLLLAAALSATLGLGSPVSAGRGQTLPPEPCPFSAKGDDQSSSRPGSAWALCARSRMSSFGRWTGGWGTGGRSGPRGDAPSSDTPRASPGTDGAAANQAALPQGPFRGMEPLPAARPLLHLARARSL